MLCSNAGRLQIVAQYQTALLGQQHLLCGFCVNLFL